MQRWMRLGKKEIDKTARGRGGGKEERSANWIGGHLLQSNRTLQTTKYRLGLSVKGKPLRQVLIKKRETRGLRIEVQTKRFRNSKRRDLAAKPSRRKEV